MNPIWGGRGPLMQVLLVKMYVKMKELGPIGGCVHRKILYVDPPMQMTTLLTAVP